MANVVYPKFKERILSSGADLTNLAVRAVLIDTGVGSYNAAHEDYADLSGVVGTESGALANKTVTNGVFDSDNITFSAVTGNTAEALALFVDSGVAANDWLICWIDSASSGLPVTPNGGDINVTVNASGWFSL